ncbi:MAG: CPBP family intramembrane metalloprotease [Candidatus Marinimicrobia bacterium]|nr:CPBP family intramembrane metalloprotease [Candidatus Neomarinimicrobiota bacterium]
MDSRKQLSQLNFFTLLAGIFWYFTFAVNMGNFWIKIALSSVVLASCSFFIEKPRSSEYQISWTNVLMGIGSAVILYGIFYAGNIFSGLLFDFASGQVGSIYQKGEGTNPFLIALILLVVTSPAEEIFWRGFFQKAAMKRYGDQGGYLFTTLIYGLVHIWSGNFMLVGAALVAGAFWGFLYLKFHNLPILIISHGIWAVTLFVLWPIR